MQHRAFLQHAIGHFRHSRAFLQRDIGHFRHSRAFLQQALLQRKQQGLIYMLYMLYLVIIVYFHSLDSGIHL